MKELTAALISLGSTSSKMLAKEMEKYFSKVDMLSIKQVEVNLGAKDGELLYNGEPMDTYDCVFAKGSYKYANLLTSIVTVLPKHTYTPLESKSFTIANDKLLTHLALQPLNIPMPKTYVVATVEAAKGVLEKINYPIVMKFPQGTHGKGVMFADSYPSASSMLDALTALKQAFLIQEFVETGGVDIRALVIGEKVAVSMSRTAADNELRANTHMGGTVASVQLDYKASRIAVEAAKAIGAEVCGVDMLIGSKGPVIMEINYSPSLQGLTRASGQNVADMVARYLYEQTMTKKENKHQSAAKDIMKDIQQPRTIGKIVTNIDLRAKRILLPPVITDLTGFTEKDEVTIEAKKGEVIIRKF